MGFWDKFKTGADAAAKITQVVAPGKAGDIARIVERVIDNENDPQNLGALRQLANEIVELKMRVDHLERVITPRR